MSEIRRPFFENEVEIKDLLDREIVARLFLPIRTGAFLYRVADVPRESYRRVISGDLNDPNDLEEFKKEYHEQAKKDPYLKDPFTYLSRSGSKWIARSIATLPEVANNLELLCQQLLPVAAYIRERVQSPFPHLTLANYLEATAQLSLQGKFNEVMIKFLQLPTDERIGFMVAPVEHQDDPLGIKSAFEGFLAYSDLKRTKEANQQVGRYKKAASSIYPNQPLDTKVFVSDIIAASGFWAKGEVPYSAFNIPNDPQVGEKAGNNVIYLFPNRIEENTQNTLAPQAKRLLGLELTSANVYDFILAHELSHGWRYPNEADLGSLRATTREACATERAQVITSSPPCSAEHNESVILGALGYAASDVKPFDSQLFEGYGRHNITLAELTRAGAYKFSGFITIRQAFVRGAIKPRLGFVDLPKILELAKERDQTLDEVDKKGDEEYAKEELTKLLTERKVYGISWLRSLFGGLKPNSGLVIPT